MKKEELKQLIKEIIQSEGIERFLSYGTEIKGGDPKLAAERMISLTDKFIKSIERALKIAGPYLGPGMKQELWKDIKKKFEGIKV